MLQKGIRGSALRTIFSTAVVHPRNRFDFWHDIACKQIIAHDSIPQCRQTFEATLQAGSLADIEMVLFNNAAMRVSREKQHIAHANAGQVFVCMQLGGSLALQQGGRDAFLTPGDLTLLDPRTPYTGEFSDGSTVLVLKVPSRWLQIRVGTIRAMTVRVLKPREPESRFASAFLKMLTVHGSELAPPADAVVRDQLLDLLALALAKEVQADGPKVSCGRSMALVKVRAAIETHLADPSLNAEQVAAAAGISLRYANSVLAAEGTSIMRHIQKRRLVRCQKAFDDPSQTHRTISEIAYGWGFSDMTHFGRKFKAAYGLSPREFRKLHGRLGDR